MNSFIIFISFCVIVNQCLAELSHEDEHDFANFSSTAEKQNLLVSRADVIISWMKKKSKKYMEEVGERWISGEKFNERQVKCLLGKGKCGEELQVIRDTLQSALSDSCSLCTDANKRTAGDALLVLLSRQPDVWKSFTKKFQDQNIDKLKDWISNK